MDRRTLKRDSLTKNAAVSCVLNIDGEQYEGKVLNYHHGGACVEFISQETLNEIKSGKKISVDFYLGKTCLHSDISSKVAWVDRTGNFTMGIQFFVERDLFSQRSERFPTNLAIKPTLQACDPIDPNRTLHFSVEDFSKEGMALTTSMSNRHLFPGMILKNALLKIPGEEPALVNFAIRNTRPSSNNSGQFVLGGEFSDSPENFHGKISKYLTHLANENSDEGLKIIHDNFGKTKKIKEGLTFNIIDSPNEYQKLLKLRKISYQKKGKLTQLTKPEDFGKGLENEGVLIAGYLGGRLICGAEIRHINEQSFWCEEFIKKNDHAKADFEQHSIEINRVIVHPDLQSTDIILGLFQRIHAYVMSLEVLPTVYLSATDKLKKLYFRLGAKEMKIRFAHPTIPGEYLNVMKIPVDVYAGASGINPIAWKMVYETTVNYYQSIGLSKDRRTKRHWAIFKILNKIEKNKKQKTTSTASKDKKAYIDSDLTKQHILANIILPYIMEADDAIGKDNTDRILHKIGLPRSYFNSRSNWVSVYFLDQFLDEYGKYKPIEELSKNAAKRSMSQEALGINYFIIKNLASPANVIRSTAKLAEKFNKSRTYKVQRFSSKHYQLKIGTVDRNLLPKHECSCINWQTSLEEALKLGGSNPSVDKLSCVYNGSDHCLYDLSWSASSSVIQTILTVSAVSSLALGTIFGLSQYVSVVTAATAVAILGLFATATFFGISLRRTKSEFEKISQQFYDFQTESQENYKDLQKNREKLNQRYKEAKLLDATSHAIHMQDDLNPILSESLNQICKSFKFTRAFLMLVDEDDVLKTAAVAGENITSDKLWKFQVSVKIKRENQQVLSSVFHSGNSIIIKDVEESCFQLNEASQALISELKTTGFIMTAIPSEFGKNWGVIVADCQKESESLERSDLVLLERVAAYLGLALNKQKKIEKEREIRQVFQKFVPAHIVQDKLDIKQISLGGQNRDVAVLFLDIRGFTNFSQTLHPQTTLNILNIFFSEIEAIITKHGGVIDKFLGDGLMAIWGQQSGIVTPSDAANAAFEVLDELPRINDMLSAQGFNKLNIGMGLSSGVAICGNIGSDNRMEFTSIGKVVNKAARLEALCKDLASPLLMSESVYVALEEQQKGQLNQHDDIEIRGLSGKAKIYSYNQPSKEYKLWNAS